MNLHFLKNTAQKLTNIKKRLAGVEALSGKDGTLLYNVVVLEKRKDELALVSKAQAIDSVEKLAQIVGTDTPIHLVLNFKGILHKKSDLHESEETMVRNVLLNANITEFYWQKTNTVSYPIMSVVRKNQVDELLDTLNMANLWVISLGLGGFHVRYLMPLLNIGQSICVNGTKMVFDNQWNMLEFEQSYIEQPAEKLMIGEDTLENCLLCAYAIAFNGLLNASSEMNIPIISITRQEFFHKQLFKKATVGVLAFFFCLLLLNLCFYYHFKSENQTALSNIAKKQSDLERLEQLKEKVKLQESLVRQTNLNRSNKASFYATEIGASVPAGIQLLEMAIFPFEGKPTDYKDGELARYDMEAIRIKGRCENSLTYNKWIQTLDSLPWTESVEHLTYKEANPSLKEFQLKILITGTSE